MQGYCVKCKKKVEIENGHEKKTKNGRHMMQGHCPHCNTKVSVFLKTPKK